jgi:tetratricopeptide (TPR) repeat protein
MPKNVIKVILIVFFMLFTIEGFCLDLTSIKTKMLMGDYKAALNEGEKLIAKDPHSPELYYLLGLCYLKEGNYLRASDIFEIIIKEFSGTRFKEEAQMGLGDTYFLRGDLSKAEISYQDVINKNPDSKLKPQIYYRLSEVAFKKGDSVLGQEYLAKIKGISPYNLEVKQELPSVAIKESGFYYTVQVGSFSKELNANNFTNKLVSSGYPAFIEESESGGSKVYRVKVGKLATRNEAEELSKKLTQEGYPTKICP